MTFWTICPHRVQRKSSWNTSRDSTTGDVKASVFCGVSARSGRFVILRVFRVLWCACTVWTFSHLECLTIFSGSSTVSVRFGLHANIVEEYVLLSALLHDQCCIQSLPRFSVSVCAAPLFSNPCLQGWVSCTCEHENRVSEPMLRCVTRARENNWDKPLLDDIIIDSLCHDCKILIHGHFELKSSTVNPPHPVLLAASGNCSGRGT